MAATDLKPSSIAALVALALPLFLYSRRALRRYRRARKLPRDQERVLILGASSGIGRAISHEYASRGARVCVVARRQEELRRVAQECTELYAGRTGKELDSASNQVCSVVADFTVVDDVVRLRTFLENVWQGVDTVVVCAGVSHLRPVMDAVGLVRNGTTFTPPQADAHGIQRAVDVANKLTSVNFLGPLISAVAFLPLLQANSISPSFLLISSLASFVPPPTRAFYASTKAASFMFYQTLALEHPAVSFPTCIVSTVKGEFRASAVDGLPTGVGESGQEGLEPHVVARRCVRAVDEGERVFYVPWWYSWLGHMLYYIFPSVIGYLASKKYNFSA